MTGTKTWPGPIAAITLFADDLAATRQFYLDVFGLPVVFEDQASAVFRFGDTLVNLLSTANAPELVTPATVAGPDVGPRAVLTVEVDDVDAKCAELQELGVSQLNGPMDRPWGVRTASFRDPAGHIWEIGA
ncbi:MAG TPA: VOC family protein [Nocardioidaceae bacterium]|nr:VOC family protein [Nocardioidaceae bacterium]